MNIGNICSRQVVTVDAASPLSQAAGLMLEHHVGALVVTSRADDGPRVVGIITDRDLALDVLARGLDATAVKVGEVAHKTLVLLSEGADLMDAITAMQESGVRRLLVKDDEDRLSGIVSLDDLLDASAEQITGLAKIVRSGIEREAIERRPAPTRMPVLQIPAMGTAAWTTVVV